MKVDLLVIVDLYRSKCCILYRNKMGKAQSKDIKYVQFALVGSTGCGKSTFVNAVRGIPNDHEDAAKVDVNTLEPAEYAYPKHPIYFCDLPGYSKQNYTSLESYWDKFELVQFDGFFILARNKTTELDLELAEKIKSVGKPFFIIRTCIDIHGELSTEELKRIVDEEEEHMSCNREEVFLVSNYDTNKWDFARLSRTIINVAREIERMDEIKKRYLDEAKKHIKKHGVSGIAEFLREKQEDWKNVELQFGVTGGAGTGKSSFMNAIRGLDDDDYERGAAKVDVEEATTERTKYVHPDNPKICFWDLPGIGTTRYTDFRSYCEAVRLQDYDIFLIFTATRFTKDDLKLAKEVKSMGKSFFLVRTKIDNDKRAEQRKRNFNEEDMLEKIRSKCMQEVKDLMSSENEIFLISNWLPNEWDFDRLINAIKDALPPLPRECLILSLSNVTRGCIKRKVALFKAQAVAVSAISATMDVIPVPIVGCVIDVALIASTLATYCQQLGLHNLTSDNCKLYDKYACVLERYRFLSNAELVSKISRKEPGKSAMGDAAMYIPIIGPVIASSISFCTTLSFLQRCIGELEVVALAVWDEVAVRYN